MIGNKEGLIGLAGVHWCPPEEGLRPRLRPSLIGRAVNKGAGAPIAPVLWAYVSGDRAGEYCAFMCAYNESMYHAGWAQLTGAYASV